MHPSTCSEVIASLSAEGRGFSFIEGSDERHLSFAAVGARAREVAQALAGLGFAPGSRVGLVLVRQSECVEIFLGALVAGVVPVPMYPPLTAGGMEEYLLRTARTLRAADAQAVIVSDALRAIVQPLDDSYRVLTVSDVGEAPQVEVRHDAVPQDLAFLQFTSGSTTTPRGVMVTQAALLANARAIAQRLALDPAHDRAVSWLPMYHDMGLIGMLVVPLLIEGSVWFLPPLEFAREPELWCDLISRVAATISFAPNFGFSLLTKRVSDAALERWKLDEWRIAGCGAEPIDISTMTAFAERLAPSGFREQAFLPCYGLAEATLAVTLSRPNRKLRTLTVDSETLGRDRVAVPPVEGGEVRTLVSCGTPVDDHTVTIVDLSGSHLESGFEGEIVVSGPSVASGYCGDEESSREVFGAGDLKTGDAGIMVEGELYVTGRIRDLIIVHGRNFYPQDIEWSASQDEATRSGGVAAFGVPGHGGEEVVLVIEAGSVVPRDEVTLQTVATRVAKNVRIEIGLRVAEVVIVAARAIPKTSSGKLRRAATRSLLQDGQLPVIQRIRI
jgi:fatty-acyl-CoA synthase